MKPPTWNELQALMPWAHLEAEDEGEVVIYTGLLYFEAENPDGPLTWMENMEVGEKQP